MAQVSIYIPDKLEEAVREAAQKCNQSVSAYIAQLLQQRLAPKEWPHEFFVKQSAGSLEDFPEDIEDFPPEEHPELLRVFAK